MALSRRKLIISGAAAIALALVGVAHFAVRFNRQTLKRSADEFYKRLPIPQLIDARKVGNTVSISAGMGLVEFVEGYETETYGYSTAYLGPTIKVHRGDKVTVRVTNLLDRITSVHWHGLLLPSDQDGSPQNPILPGATWEPKLTIDQPSSTAWFHPHLPGDTGRQVYMGLAALLYIEDEESEKLGLPNQYGVDDLPLVLQDRTFDDAGQFLYDDSPSAVMQGSRGDWAVINGVIGPVAEVPKVIVRLRILNAANARIFRLRFHDRRHIHVIANDNGFLASPARLTELLISPGERFEVLVDFSDGEVAVLQSYPDHNTRPPAEISPIFQTFTDLTDTLAPIVRFDPVDEIAPRITSKPSKLIDLPEAKLNNELKRRFFLLDSMVDANERFIDGGASTHGEGNSKTGEHMTGSPSSGLALGMKMGINGKSFDKSRVDLTLKVGDKEIWELRGTDMAHPFHIHGASFRILNLDGSPPPAHLLGWKDTVLVNQSAELLVSFDRPADSARPFPFYCSILEHEDAGMMGQYVTT